jgi:hypothetical protein
VTAQELTDAEAATVDRFGIFEPEQREAAIVEEVARAISGTRDAHNGSGFPCRCGWMAGFGEGWEKRLDRHRQLAAGVAAITAYRATQDGGAT